ncbi:MAG: type II toxin-antitoxin system HicA family toxin [Flavobacteriales bacterium]|nr:type II toxin-antitoxin system HicA family toxin [Flavobacteriales bacterium]MEB2340640.1 type II toxin-antitoxin system HicA family toxin [Flavobacteriia bacterium]
MSTQRLSNISFAQYCGFLELAHCSLIRTSSGHDVFARADLLRPIVVQNHITPVPERIIRQGLRALGISKADFFAILEGKKEVVRKSPQSKVFEIRLAKK